MTEARLVTQEQLANIVADFHGGSAAHPSRADRQEAEALFAALPTAAPAEGLRLAPSVYAQGHGLPDHCAEHGDIPRDQSMVYHVLEAHGLTKEQWYALEEADRIRGIEPFDPHASHEHAALARHESGSE